MGSLNGGGSARVVMGTHKPIGCEARDAQKLNYEQRVGEEGLRTGEQGSIVQQDPLGVRSQTTSTL